MKGKLTERQRNLAIEKSKGLTDAEACRNAGYNAKSDRAACTQVRRMMQNDAFVEYLEELRKPKEEEAVMSRDYKRRLLKKIADSDNTKEGDRVRAMAEDAKLAGHYEPDRTEIEMGPRSLMSIRERAKQLTGILVRRYSDDSEE